MKPGARKPTRKRLTPRPVGSVRKLVSALPADYLRHPDDKESIGLLLCRSRERLVVEYALRDLRKPIGVAEWQTRLVASLRRKLKGNLPTVEEIEREPGQGPKGT